MWCPDTSHVISAAIGTNPWAATKEERVKKKKLRKSLQFGERPIVPRRRPFWSVEWHMCAILIAADADILFVDCQLLNSCAWSWKRFFPGQQNKDELPHVRNLKNSSANTVPLAHYLLFSWLLFIASVEGCMRGTIHREKLRVVTAATLRAELAFTISKWKLRSDPCFDTVSLCKTLLLGVALFALAKCKTSV